MRDTLAEIRFRKFWERYSEQDTTNTENGKHELKAFIRAVWMSIYQTPLRAELIAEKIDPER